MGWSIGYDSAWKRDIGYGVPATCDHPGCGEAIDRGIGYVCGGEPRGGDHGCGLYFCGKHLAALGQLCAHCAAKDGKTFEPTPDTPQWIAHKLSDPSWVTWRAENPEWVTEHSEKQPALWSVHKALVSRWRDRGVAGTRIGDAIHKCADELDVIAEPAAELPGMWEAADFTYGETDAARESAQRQADPFADLVDKRMSELDDEQKDRAYEKWLRDQIGANWPLRDVFLAMTRVIDRLRAAHPPKEAEPAPQGLSEGAAKFLAFYPNGERRPTEASKPEQACDHQYHYFGDQQKRRRCNRCNELEPVQAEAPPPNTTMKRDEWGALSPEARKVMHEAIRARTLRAAQGAASIRDVSLGQAEAPTAGKPAAASHPEFVSLEEHDRILQLVRQPTASNAQLIDRSRVLVLELDSASGCTSRDQAAIDGARTMLRLLGQALEAALATQQEAQPQAEREAFERAMKETWQMINPLAPSGDAGSYARGEYNGIVAALKTLRENFERAARAAQQATGERG